MIADDWWTNVNEFRVLPYVDRAPQAYGASAGQPVAGYHSAGGHPATGQTSYEHNTAYPNTAAFAGWFLIQIPYSLHHLPTVHVYFQVKESCAKDSEMSKHRSPGPSKNLTTSATLVLNVEKLFNLYLQL